MAQQYRDQSSRSNEYRSRPGSRYEAGDDSDESWGEGSSSQWESSGGLGDARDYGRSDTGYGRPQRGQYRSQQGGRGGYGGGSASSRGSGSDYYSQSPGSDWRGGRYTSQEDDRTSPYYGPGDRGYGMYGRSHRLSQDSGQRWGQSQGYRGQPGYGQQDYGQDDGWQGYGQGYGDEYGQASERGYGGRQQYGQGYRGKGPKGYQRSDERLKEVVCETLTDDPMLDASNITVTVRSGEVTLEGSVDDRRAKHRAEDLVDDCSGVKEVRNNLRVEKSQGVSWDENSATRSSSSVSASDAGNGSRSSTASRGTSGTTTTATQQQSSRPS